VYYPQLIVEAQPSEPWKPARANAVPIPAKPAEHFPPLPTGEGRGEGRLRTYALNNSWHMTR